MRRAPTALRIDRRRRRGSAGASTAARADGASTVIVARATRFRSRCRCERLLGKSVCVAPRGDSSWAWGRLRAAAELSAELVGDAFPHTRGRPLELGLVHRGTRDDHRVAQLSDLCSAVPGMMRGARARRRTRRAHPVRAGRAARGQGVTRVTSNRLRMRVRLRRMWLFTVPSGMSSRRAICSMGEIVEERQAHHRLGVGFELLHLVGDEQRLRQIGRFADEVFGARDALHLGLDALGSSRATHGCRRCGGVRSRRARSTAAPCEAS